MVRLLENKKVAVALLRSMLTTLANI